MPSLIDRVNLVNAPHKQAPTKSYTGNSLWYAGSSVNRDLRADEYGAAQAVALVTEVQRAVKFWEQWLSGLTWHVYDGNTDAILTSSTDRKPPKGSGAMWFNAMQRFSRQWKHDFFESIAFSDWVYGETFIGKLRNTVQTADFMWLNPLATEPMILSGKIDYYQYQSDDPQYPYRIDPQHVAFRIAQRNPFDDLRGNSPVITAINDINIVENAKQALINYYRKGMQLGGVVSGKPSSEGAWSIDGNTLDEIKEQMARGNKGVQHFYEWFFSNAPVDINQFQPIDIEKNYAIIEPLRKQIAFAMGVPPVLSGDPTDATYENTDDTLKNWRTTDGIPYAKKVSKFINDDLLPSVEPNTDVYFGFDYKQFEVEPPETVSTDVTVGISSLGEGQKRRGLEVDKRLNDVYIINNRPMHADIIAQIAHEVPPEYQTPIAQPVNLTIPRERPALPQAVTEPDSEPVAPLPSLPAPMATADTPMATADTPIIITDSKSIWIGDDHHAHLEPFAPKHSSAYDEFAAWKAFAFKGKSARVFEPHWLRGDIGDTLHAALAVANGDKDAIGAAFREAVKAMDATFKALSATRINFEEDFNSLIKKAMAENNFGRVQWSSAMRAIIRRYGRMVYSDGLIEGGVLDGALSEEDENAVASLVGEQSSYVSNLGAALFKDETVSPAMADQKAELWFNRSLKPFYEAGLLSADANGIYEFAGKDGQESCTTCMHLKGQRHRLKTWARRGLRPGTDGDSFECGGWKCEHKLIKVFARERGNWLS